MEKAIEYRLLGAVNFEKNKFNVYVDNKHRKFYLKILDTKDYIDLTYPTLEEFIGLNKLFEINYIKDKYYFLGRSGKRENKKESNDKEEKLSKRRIVSFIPKILTKSGLISLAMAITLSGCTLGNTNEVDSTSQSENLIVSQETKRVEDMTDEEVLEYYGYNGYYKKMADGIYALNSMSINGEIFTVCRDVDEFKKAVGLEGIPTYEDIIEAIKANETITGRYEEWFIEAITNLSNNREFDGTDFSVLLYNIENMKLREKTSDEIINESNVPTAQAYFFPETKEVAVNPERVTQVVFLHEVLGHACSETVTDDNVIFSSKAILAVIERTEDGSVYDIYNSMIGAGLEEGKADMIAEVALNGKESSPSSYDIEKESFREFKETLGLSWKDVINSPSTLAIITKMSEAGIEDPIEYIDNTDSLYHVGIFEEFDDEICFKNNIGDFLIEYAKIQIELGRSKDDVINEISEVIKSSPTYSGLIGINTVTPKDVTNLQEFEEYIKTSISEIGNEKSDELVNKEEIEIE